MTTLGMRSKPRMMKRMFVLLALTTIGALASVTAAQAQIVTNETVSSAYSGYVPCTNGGAGELVTGRIDVHNLVTSTVNGKVEANNLRVREVAHITRRGDDVIVDHDDWTIECA